MKKLWKKPVIGPCAWKYAAMDVLLAEVAGRHRISVGMLLSKRDWRWPATARIRQEAMFEVVAGTALTWGEIASRFGRARKTISHGVLAHCKLHQLPLPRGMKPEGRKAWIDWRAAA